MLYSLKNKYIYIFSIYKRAILLCFCFFLSVCVFAQDSGIDETYVKNTKDTWGNIYDFFFDDSRFNKSYALVIGIGNYNSEWGTLEAPAKDAMRIRDYLIHEAGFDYVITLTDSKASAQRIKQLMIEHFPERVKQDDRFLFYFSGHGTQRKIAKSTLGYLVLQSSIKRAYSNMISMNDIHEWDLLLSPAKQTLFILDSCFSGLAGIQRKSAALLEKKLDRLAQFGHHLITAGTANEESISSIPRWNGSLFTNAFLKGVSGAADSQTEEYSKDGVVSLKELMKYIEDTIDNELVLLNKEKAGNTKFKMTPQISDLHTSNKGEFFFITKLHKNSLVKKNADDELIKGLPNFPQRKGGITLDELKSSLQLNQEKNNFINSPSTIFTLDTTLAQHILLNSPFYFPNQELKIKIKTYSSNINSFALFREDNQVKRIQAKFSKSEGGIYISYRIPKNTKPSKYFVEVFIQEINSRKEFRKVIEYEVR